MKLAADWRVSWSFDLSLSGLTETERARSRCDTRCDNIAMSWLDDELKRERAAEQRADQQARLQLHRAEVVRAKGPELLDALTNTVEKMVQDYSIKTADDPKRRAQFTRNPIGGFSVRKSHYPATSLDCALSSDSMAIVVVRTLTQNGQSSTTERRDLLGMAVNERNDVTIYVDDRPWTVSDAAENLLRPVLFPPRM